VCEKGGYWFLAFGSWFVCFSARIHPTFKLQQDKSTAQAKASQPNQSNIGSDWDRLGSIIFR
jgi:hypothetical protein